ncbi:hypothetical protein EV121DRAFT_297045 [Schizophyllum commune]
MADDVGIGARLPSRVRHPTVPYNPSNPPSAAARLQARATSAYSHTSNADEIHSPLQSDLSTQDNSDQHRGVDGRAETVEEEDRASGTRAIARDAHLDDDGSLPSESVGAASSRHATLLSLLSQALDSDENASSSGMDVDSQPIDPLPSPRSAHSGVHREAAEEAEGENNIYRALPAPHLGTLFFLAVHAATGPQVYWCASPLSGPQFSLHMALRAAIECNADAARVLQEALASSTTFYVAGGRTLSADAPAVLQRTGRLSQAVLMRDVCKMELTDANSIALCPIDEEELDACARRPGHPIIAIYAFIDSPETVPVEATPRDQPPLTLQQAYLSARFPTALAEWASYQSAGYGSAYRQQLFYRAVCDICNKVGIPIVARSSHAIDITWEDDSFPLSMYDVAFWLGERHPRTMQNIQTDRNKAVRAQEILATVVELIDHDEHAVPEFETRDRMLKNVLDLILDDAVLLPSPLQSGPTISQVARKAVTLTRSALIEKVEDVRERMGGYSL